LLDVGVFPLELQNFDLAKKFFHKGKKKINANKNTTDMLI